METDLFRAEEARVCIAGKNDIAVQCLWHLLAFGVSPDRICVVLNNDDTRRNTWQRSLGFHAHLEGIAIRDLDEVMQMEGLWFFSLEFDRILRPEKFRSQRLYNLHFSKLPAYRGVSTAVWPILRGEKQSGVTFHRIDSGVDTGPIIHQRTFDIGSDWTARDLYLRYLSEGAVLFREAISMISSCVVQERQQEESEASLFRRADLDYSNLSVDLKADVRQVFAQLRAYTFWEYQLPMVNGRKVWSSQICAGRQTAAAGTVSPNGKMRAILSANGGDIELIFSPYDDLYAWASGQGSEMEELMEVPDLDLTDANGWNAMMRASHAGNVSALRKLAAAGASVCKPNLRGTTPLMYAFTRMMTRGRDDAFEALLHLGADPFAKDLSGRSIKEYAPIHSLPGLRVNYPEIFQ
jgi:methionyl-tRNA formyltransferase